jgi:hypothetical protein
MDGGGDSTESFLCLLLQSSAVRLTEAGRSKDHVAGECYHVLIMT